MVNALDEGLVEVDFERGEVRVVRKYRLWHDFGPVKRFFAFAEPGYAKYIEKREDGLYLVTSDVEKGVEEVAISEDVAREIIAEVAEHWIPHYEWCE